MTFFWYVDVAICFYYLFEGVDVLYKIHPLVHKCEPTLLFQNPDPKEENKNTKKKYINIYTHILCIAKKEGYKFWQKEMKEKGFVFVMPFN